MNTRALLITQYDRFGGVGQQEYLENYIHEELDVNIEGYANIDSFSEYEVIREMKNDTDFLKWYIEENDLIDWDEAQKDIDEANELIKQGY